MLRLICPKVSITRSYKTHIPIHGLKTPQNVQTIQNVPEILEFENCLKDSSLKQIVEAYRNSGYIYGNKDPLNLCNKQHISERFPIEVVNISSNDIFNVEGVLNIKGKTELSFEELQTYLNRTYCQSLSLELYHIQGKEKKQWLYQAIENTDDFVLSNHFQKEICQLLSNSQTFERFLAKKFPTLKRYGGEGAESMLAFFHHLLNSCGEGNVEDVLISTQHRGRLSLMTGLFNYPPANFFHKIKGNAEFSTDYNFTGDVLSHLTISTDLTFNTKSLHVSMIPNPSHLEASHPVVSGKTRSRQLTKACGHYGDLQDIDRVVNVHVHGDAAVAGQGIVMETFAMSSLPHFDVGGTIHLIVNNQMGFTTPQERGRSSGHCSDIGKMTGCPIIHVNGDYPEEVARAAKIAFQYKCKFHEDIIVNMHCFRRWGHNELDDPTFTNPSMYKIINERISVPELYQLKLIKDNILSDDDVKHFEAEYSEYLNQEFAKSNIFHEAWRPFEGNWKNLQQADHKSTSIWNTGCNTDFLKRVGLQSVNIPSTFALHAHLDKTFVKARQKKLEDGTDIDWATAEALAIGSLLLEDNHVRICGQDVGRGTFNHRHVMLVDQNTEQIYIPFNHMEQDQKGFLEVANSLLSEEAVLAFEYGMSIENPNHLCIWEAQFGDFFNGAQIIIDTFISNGELKWLLQSGLVMLLPHGMDGAGPDHSSCKIERFLQLCDSAEDRVDGDDVNMQIVNPTTPAQYFHLLRRQQIRNYRKPLIVASPKLILRMKNATSALSEMDNGTYFQPVLCDVNVDPKKVSKLLFCSGKYYYELDRLRQQKKKDDIAIIRVESLCPFPSEELKDELLKYPEAKDFIWCQEEHRNQGAWSFIYPRFKNLLNVEVSYCGRDVLGVAAVGVGKLHAKEGDEIAQSIFGQ